MMQRIAIASLGMFSALALSLAGCEGEPGPGQQGPDAMPAPDAGGAPPMPPMPALGGQIDRVGRPLVTTMLVEAFEPDEGERNQGRDAYNGDDEPATWQADWTDEIRTSLAILDSLDSAGEDNEFGCTNPLAELGTGEDPEALRYRGLAEILADDRLYLNAVACVDGGYLGVENQVAFADGDAVTACGGRRPTDDVVDITYTTLIAGPGAVAISDTLAADDGEIGASNTAFPFLGEPHSQTEEGQ